MKRIEKSMDIFGSKSDLKALLTKLHSNKSLFKIFERKYIHSPIYYDLGTFNIEAVSNNVILLNDNAILKSVSYADLLSNKYIIVLQKEEESEW